MIFESEKKSIRETVEEYKDSVEKLSAYLPWLYRKSGDTVMSGFKVEGMRGNFSIPTYDPTLLSLVKEIEKTGKINKNYEYSYIRHKIYTEEDEISHIRRAEIQNIDLIFDILSKYVIRGRIKGSEWNKGVQNGVYLEAVKKLKELMELWKEPGQ